MKLLDEFVLEIPELQDPFLLLAGLLTESGSLQSYHQQIVA